tara:strand:- start:321 stop:1556 length:1236 start_codon:yes stop_codon:yes gene_type:complete
MSKVILPDNSSEILETVKWANAKSKTLEVRGNHSKSQLGRLMQTSHELGLQKISGVEEYSPNELVITAKAGTPLKIIEMELAKNNQHLTFEPPDFGFLFMGGSNHGTIGGAISCNFSGPRRVVGGAVRDHFLGFNAISGRGEEFKSGGKVVKNVTGFDLSKLIAGSHGTLAILTEVTLKALPSPEKTRTILIKHPDISSSHQKGIDAMSDALMSSHEVSGAAFLPEKISSRSEVTYVKSANSNLTAIRIEGPAPSVKYRCEALKNLLKKFGEIEELHTQNSIELWREIRDVRFLKSEKNRAIWRVSTPPASGAKFTSNILKKYKMEPVYDWGGGLIWLSIDDPLEDHQTLIHSTIKQTGGHATLFQSSDKAKSNSPVFQPLSKPLLDIARRVKDGFDPNHVLNPGRMYKGI